MPNVDHVACSICGCVCDDLRLTIEKERITRAEGACPLAEPWFLHQAPSTPTARIAGLESPLEDAVHHAASLLRQARAPLVVGLAGNSIEGQRAAIALADRLGGTVDTTSSALHTASVLALQEVGQSTCTLGEVKNRADLVIFWGADPVVSHPRHLERYSGNPRGKFIPEGKLGRTIVVADVHPSASSKLADVFLPIEPGQDFEALWTLRGLVRGCAPAPGTSTGASLPLLTDLVERMKTCRFGIVFFDQGLVANGSGKHNVAALFSLVADLNDFTRFYAQRMRGSGDSAGSSVLAWQTGFPMGVNLSRGHPRYNPGEFSANEMLERGEIDVCLATNGASLARLSEGARAHLRSIPTIALDAPGADPGFVPTVSFTTAVPGLHQDSTALRMDEVSIPLRRVLPTSYPTDQEVLERILAKLGAQ